MSNYEDDMKRVKELTPEEMPAFPHKGHIIEQESLEQIEQEDLLRKTAPRVSVDGEQLEIQHRKKVEASLLQNANLAYSEKNPEYTNIAKDIPSRMAFYQQDSLCIRTFKTSHIVKLIEAMEMEDFAALVDVVSSALEPNFSARNLTVGDFFYCMYWLKINSFNKAPMKVSFTCNSAEHYKLIAEGKLTNESLENSHTIKNTGELTISYMTDEKIAKANEVVKRVKQKYGVDLYVLQMNDFLELQDYLKKTTELSLQIESLLEQKYGLETEYTSEMERKLKTYQEEKNKLDAMYALKDYAPYIMMAGKTLHEKVDFLKKEDFDSDFLFEVDEFIDCLEHEVKETASCRCEGCNATMEVQISIDALQFFPDIIRKRLAR